jgi:serine/threonine protein kinase
MEISSEESDEDDLVGTEEYMAPEAFEGEFHFGTDLWSLGVILE